MILNKTSQIIEFKLLFTSKNKCVNITFICKFYNCLLNITSKEEMKRYIRFHFILYFIITVFYLHRNLFCKKDLKINKKKLLSCTIYIQQKFLFNAETNNSFTVEKTTIWFNQTQTEIKYIFK